MILLVFKSAIKKYYTTITRDVVCKNQAGKASNVVALDPGVCTFQSAYGLDGSISFFGYECRKILNKSHLRIDHINRDMDNIKSRGKYTSRGKQRKINNRKKKKVWIYKRIKDLITTLHYEVIKSLGKFPVILLPEFATQDMMKKLNRNQKRELQSLGHYTFKQRLMHKCKLWTKFIYN